MTITSKFKSTCTKCNGKINIGDPVEWSKKTGAHHITCPSPSKKTTPRSNVSDTPLEINDNSWLQTVGAQLDSLPPLDALDRAVVLLRTQQKRVDALYRKPAAYSRKDQSCATRN